MRPSLEVADVFRRYGPRYRQTHGATLSQAQRRVMHSIEVCRTAALGGHVEQCDACGHQRIAYNSCRDRHCPKSQSLARAQWLEDRRTELLETAYFHVVFTVPQEIAAIAYQNKRVVYNILFRATGLPDRNGTILVAKDFFFTTRAVRSVLKNARLLQHFMKCCRDILKAKKRSHLAISKNIVLSTRYE